MPQTSYNRPTNRPGGAVSNPNQMQNVGVPSVPAVQPRKSYAEDDLRMLDGKTLVLHHRHLQSGTRSDPNCRFCQSGLSGVITHTPVPEEPDPVVQSDGADESGDAPSPPASEWNWGG